MSTGGLSKRFEMNGKRIIRLIWAVVGRMILYGVALFLILSIIVSWRMKQRESQWGGRRGWRGNREPAQRTIPRINKEYDLSIQQQIQNYPLNVCLVDGNALDYYGHSVDFDHNGMVVRLCSEDCLRDFRGDATFYISRLLEASLAK